MSISTDSALGAALLSRLFSRQRQGRESRRSFLLLTISCLCWITFMTSPGLEAALPTDANYDENNVGEYELPDPFKSQDGSRIESADEWRTVRRPELLALFAEHVYGKSPAPPAPVAWKVISESQDALEGRAIRKEIEIALTDGPDPVTMTMLLYIPKLERPAPAFLGLNFYGNQACTTDPDVQINPNWMRSHRDIADAVVKNQATEASRGINAGRWPISAIIDRGYALATIYYGDIDPDFDDGFQNGVHPHFYKEGQTRPTADEWGAIAAWSWGLSRGLDYLVQDKLIDGDQVAVMGHSRLGKAALWAGAQDERFALVISNNSGCGGAALSRRNFGEQTARINRVFPHWFCENFKRYNDNEAAMPVDQHLLIALMAPRPVYVASAENDLWADPRGEFLSAAHADPVYRLLGTDGFGGDAAPESSPAVNVPLANGRIGYHLRSGEHDVTDYDWDQYLNFADKHFRK